jgi:hypothetical protein
MEAEPAEEMGPKGISPKSGIKVFLFEHYTKYWLGISRLVLLMNNPSTGSYIQK